MNRRDIAIRSAIAGVIALGLGIGSQSAFAAKGDTEKCAGIAKAGKNDCGSATNACEATLKVDRDAEAWIYVPKGTCQKIAGGVLADNKQYNVRGGKEGMMKK